MNAAVLAQASNWTYVAAAYVVTIGSIGAYAASIVVRARKVNRALPPQERRWL